MKQYTENQLSKIIFECALEVHRTLGPGLPESVYQKCLKYELEKAGIQVENEKELPVSYKELTISEGYRIGLLVADKVIVEVKSVRELSDIHMSQLLTYLKLSNCKLGLLINFNVLLIKEGIKRVVNNL